jgi:RimJ/RimL family protein N-acetyltransferase
MGIGRALIQALLDWAAGDPLIEKVTLAVFSTNEHAIALYQTMGFEVEGRCPGDMKINGEYVDSILMYRFVKPG